MYSWIIAHNLGIILLLIPCMIVAKIIIMIEDAIRARLSKKA